MERKGSCLMCGDCCKHVGWFDIGDNYQMLEYLEAIGNIIIEKNNSGYKVCVPHIC